MTTVRWAWATVVLVAVLVSVFLGTLLVITPVTRRMDADAYVEVQRAMVNHVTPIVSLALVSALLCTLVALRTARRDQTSSRLLAVALACLVVIGISSLAVNVPINGHLNAWRGHVPPSTRTRLRDRWDLFHVVRTALSVGALVASMRVAVTARSDDGSTRAVTAA